MRISVKRHIRRGGGVRYACHGERVLCNRFCLRRADLELLLPREEMNEETLHNLDMELQDLIPKIAELVEVAGR